MTTHLHSISEGQGRPLLAIHGFPHDHTLWDAQRAALAPAARVITPDLRGFGASPPAEGVLSMREYATDLKNLLNEIRATPAVIMGLSMGGYVALAFAALFPDAVSALILCNTRAASDSAEARAARLENARRVEIEGVWPVVGGMLDGMTSASSRQSDPGLNARVEAMMRRQPAAGVAAALRAMAERPDRSALLAGLRMPVLVITGSHDTLIPPAESEAMAAALPNGRLASIPGAGHLTCLEDPDAFNGLVLEFLRRLGG